MKASYELYFSEGGALNSKYNEILGSLMEKYEEVKELRTHESRHFKLPSEKLFSLVKGNTMVSLHVDSGKGGLEELSKSYFESLGINLEEAE